MSLEMKQSCQGCPAGVPQDSEAYICSFECTFCAECAGKFHFACPHCGGGLVARPRRLIAMDSREIASKKEAFGELRSGWVWSISFGIWAFVALATSVTLYEMYHLVDPSMQFSMVVGPEFSSIFTYAPLTPFAYAFAMRFPIQRSNWVKPALLQLAGGLAFTCGHLVLKAATPYGYYDATSHEWTSAIWNSQLHTFRDPWTVVKGMFLLNVVDDVIGTYVPIVLIAHVMSYYRSLRERELRATQLEGQLVKARLQTLKSQLQPHFLFNTLHSISALMLTDVDAADRMMTSLSDLLRMSLEDNGNQITTLKREIEFLDVYLDIEKTRFDDRFRVVFDVDPQCLDAQVPHLLLQPLVENAVRHGVSRRLSSGKIEVVAKHQEMKLDLWVRDNGPGILQPSETPVSHGLGLRLTRERLMALYGTTQSCEIAAAPGGGAEVHVQIPFLVTTEEPCVAAVV
jgi:two-component system, LytTR family, sensor kinase